MQWLCRHWLRRPGLRLHRNKGTVTVGSEQKFLAIMFYHWSRKIPKFSLLAPSCMHYRCRITSSSAGFLRTRYSSDMHIAASSSGSCSSTRGVLDSNRPGHWLLSVGLLVQHHACCWCACTAAQLRYPQVLCRGCAVSRPLKLCRKWSQPMMHSGTALHGAPQAPQTRLCDGIEGPSQSCAVTHPVPPVIRRVLALLHGRDVRIVPVYGQAPAYTSTSAQQSLAEFAQRLAWHGNGLRSA